MYYAKDSGSRCAALGISDTGVVISTDPNLAYSASSAFIPFDTTSSFNTYRLTANASGLAVAINGVPLVRLPLGGGSGPANYHWFADGTSSYESETELEWVRWSSPANIALDPRRTFLTTDVDDVNAMAPAILDLQHLGITAGTRLRLTAYGDFLWNPAQSLQGANVVGVFSSNAQLLTADNPHRVPGAIASSAPAFASAPTFHNVPTDIPEDFVLGDLEVIVPAGASHLFLGADDVWWQDNIDPEMDFGMTLELVQPAPTSSGVSFCFGQGCPCGNDDSAAGCANSSGFGALLSSSGSASIASDDLSLTLSDAPALKGALFFMGESIASALLGDGRRCVAPGPLGLRRVALGQTDAFGTMTVDHVVSAANASSAGTLTAGTTWNFQTWFRDPTGPCGRGANLSSAMQVVFGP